MKKKKPVVVKFMLTRWKVGSEFPESLGDFLPSSKISDVQEAAKEGEFSVEEIKQMLSGCQLIGKDGHEYTLQQTL